MHDAKCEFQEEIGDIIAPICGGDGGRIKGISNVLLDEAEHLRDSLNQYLRRVKASQRSLDNARKRKQEQEQEDTMSRYMLPTQR